MAFLPYRWARRKALTADVRRLLTAFLLSANPRKGVTLNRFLNSVSAIGTRIRAALLSAAVVPALLLGGAPAVPTVTAVTSAVSGVASTVATYAAPAAVAVVIFTADSAFAQTDPPEDAPEFEDFPVFFDFKSLVTKSVAFIGTVGVIAIGAVVGWTMMKGMLNYFLRRMRA